MVKFSCTDYASGIVTIQRVKNNDCNYSEWRVHFIGYGHDYSYDCDQWSDVVELLEVYDFGGFNYEKKSE